MLLVMRFCNSTEWNTARTAKNSLLKSTNQITTTFKYSFCWFALFSFQRLLHFLNLNSISIHKQEHGGKNEIKMLWYKIWGNEEIRSANTLLVLGKVKFFGKFMAINIFVALSFRWFSTVQTTNSPILTNFEQRANEWQPIFVRSTWSFRMI